LIREGVILAAGLGTRLSAVSKGKPKFLVEVMGRPLVTYPVSFLKWLKVKKINIIVPHGWKKHAEEILNEFDLDIRIMENDKPERDNGYSFYLSKELVSSSKFILMMTDHVFSQKFLSSFIKRSRLNLDADILIAGDKNPKYVDIDEATKIYTTHDGRVIQIGKELVSFDYIDTGLFIFDRRTYDVAEEVIEKKDVIKLAHIITEIASRENFDVRVVDVTGFIWTEIDTVEDYLSAHYDKKRKIIERIINKLRAVNV